MSAMAYAMERDPYPYNFARLTLTTYLDTDSDGMWDEWEIAHGTQFNDSADAAVDADGDGHTNLQEFQAGTDPRDRNHVKLFTRFTIEQGEIHIGFRGALGNSYRIERSDDLRSWITFFEIQLDTTNEIELVDTPLATTRYYRALRLP
jgi:hypothetical protein